METVLYIVCVCTCVSETEKMHKQKEIEGSPLR